MELTKGPSRPCCNSRSSPTYPSPLERKHESPAHIQRSPVSASKLERRFLSLRVRERIPGVPIASQEESLSTGKARGTPGWCHHSHSPPHTRLHSRGSPRVPPTSRGAPLLPPSSRGGILSLSGRSSIPGVHVSSQEEALSTGKARGTPDSCTHSQRPPDVSVHSMETCFSCTASTF